jgi:hypothetical protein
MAHQLAENPIIIDSATNNNNYSISTNKVKVTGVEWLQPANNNDEVILLSEDNNNSVIWAAYASQNVNTGPYFSPGWVKGLYLRKLESGKLAIFFE